MSGWRRDGGNGDHCVCLIGEKSPLSEGLCGLCGFTYIERVELGGPIGRMGDPGIGGNNRWTGGGGGRPPIILFSVVSDASAF